MRRSQPTQPEDDQPELPAPRLFVILAKSAHVAVVVRRGPSSWTQLTLWSTDRDVFTEGSWFRGRIYAEKCDLSPNGELFVYAAHQGRRSRTSYTHSWTAVSRPPWLHALALWPMGTTYGGGGRFVANRRLTLRGARQAHPSHPPTGLEIVDGPAEYQESTGEVDGADWTGRDQSHRLVYAMQGRIFARVETKDVGRTPRAGDRPRHDIELADFRQQRPRPAPPPEEALRPIGALRR
jgi:hypothetical protein